MAAAEPGFRGDSEANGCSASVELGGKDVYSSFRGRCWATPAGGLGAPANGKTPR